MRALFFIVEGWKQVGDRVFVGGRNCGDIIRVGDEFSSTGPLSSLERRPTRLRIERILFYRKYMNQLDPVMTAELELSGSIDDLSSAQIELHGSSQLNLFEKYEVLGTGEFHLDPM
jgi:hypothetical protein